MIYSVNVDDSSRRLSKWDSPVFYKNSLPYYRLVTHLKYFAKRVFTEQESADEIDDDMNEMVKHKYPQAYECANKIAELIAAKNHYKINSDEKFYLTIHIAKVISQKLSKVVGTGVNISATERGDNQKIWLKKILPVAINGCVESSKSGAEFFS